MAFFKNKSVVVLIAVAKYGIFQLKYGSQVCPSWHVGLIISSYIPTLNVSMFHLQGSTQVSYALTTSADATIADVYSCADELSTYLRDFDNWGLSVIPPVQNCPHPVFDPQQFFDGTTGRDWLCLTNLYYSKG